MAVTVLWCVLLAAVAVLEVVAHRPGSRIAGLEAISGRLWRRVPGRVLLAVCWAFVGWHLFARYTVPR